jgi:HPr kinase/phosphorylase
MTIAEIPDQEHTALSVADFIKSAPSKLSINLLAGSQELATRTLTVPQTQKIGLALAGVTHFIREGLIQIAGKSEIWFINQLESEERRQILEAFTSHNMPCILITNGLEAPAELIEACNNANLPLLSTPLTGPMASGLITEFLQNALAPRDIRHGVLLDLYGLGVLIEGRSGIGKSECALDLIARGHRLISDDVVEIIRVGTNRLMGRAPELIREHIEIHGLGILNIRDLFGVIAISGPKRIGLLIRLERWEDADEVDRLGIDTRTIEILNVSLPIVLIPVSPGRNLSTLVETAVRIHLLRLRGYNAAESFVKRHNDLLFKSGPGHQDPLTGDEV